MADIEQQLRQAAQVLRAGRKEEARTILVAVVDEQEHNERAWLYLSAAVDTLEEQQICLENVLTINPTNDKARQGLERVNAALAARQAPPAKTYAPPFLADDAPQPAEDAGGPPDALYAEAQMDSLGRDPSALATSVDWGRDDGPAAYGSGRQVDLPSEQEYDDWVQGLNLAAGPTYPTPAPMPAPPPAAERGRARSLEESLRSTIAFDDDGTLDGEADALVPPRDRLTEPDDLSEVLQRSAQTSAPVFAALVEPEVAAAQAETLPPVAEAAYYAYIPADIEPLEGGVDWRGMAYLLAVAVLVALNALSLGYLLR